MDFKESRNWWPVYTNHSVITSRPWSQEVRGFSMSLNLLTFKVIQSAVWWLFSQHKSTDATDLLDDVFALFLFPTTRFPSFSFFYFSLQSSEQKQAPVSSRASLPVQSQTRTTVSTLWFSFFFIFSPFMISLWLSSVIPFPLLCRFWCVTWSVWKHDHGVRGFILVEGSGLAPGDTVPLCAPVESWKRQWVSDVCVCVSMLDFKRWKCACSECFAWTRVEFLFRNIEFSQSVRAGHTDAAKPPTRPPPLSFSSHIPRHTLSLCFSPIGASMLSPHLCSFFPLRLSDSLFVLSSERIVSLGWRLKHLNFIAVYIGLLSRELGVRVCVCVGACLNLIVCISIIHTVLYSITSLWVCTPYWIFICVTCVISMLRFNISSLCVFSMCVHAYGERC